MLAQPITLRPATVEAGFTAFIAQLGADQFGFYKSFPQPDGHTIVGRMVADWQELPDNAPVVALLDNGTTVRGNLDRAALREDADLRLRQPGAADFVTCVEWVQSLWQSCAVLNGEVFTVPAA